MFQGCLSGGRAAVSRGDLTDTEWRILNPLLPDRGERGPAIADKRRTMNGILWVLRTGAPWRDMPERYGNWNSVFVSPRLPTTSYSTTRQTACGVRSRTACNAWVSVGLTSHSCTTSRQTTNYCQLLAGAVRDCARGRLPRLVEDAGGGDHQGLGHRRERTRAHPSSHAGGRSGRVSARLAIFADRPCERAQEHLSR